MSRRLFHLPQSTDRIYRDFVILVKNLGSREGGNDAVLFHGKSFQLCKMQRALEVGSDAGCTTT